MVAEIEDLAATCRADPTPLVLTHGEPNTGNVFRDDTGRLYLIDWGDLKYGPPERDLVSLNTDRPPVREPFARFYQLRWDLGEIAEYTARFAAPHPGDAEDDGMWRELSLYLR
jgi:spectinomycin phosphotransferase